MARPLLKIQRYFRRKPVRFFSFILLYLTAGSLVFLHSSYVGGNFGSGGRGRDPLVAAEMGGGRAPSTSRQEMVAMGRVFRDPHRHGRRYSPAWMKRARQDEQKAGGRGGEGAWNRALKGRNGKDAEDGRAKYVGCYVDDIHKRALRGVSFYDYKKMSVFRCQDNCAERGYLYAGLEFGAECFCGHKVQGANVSDSECNMECKGERTSACGGANRLSIFRLELSHESARRYGSAIFKGCFLKPGNVSLALPVMAVIQNMSVDKCVDMCTEKPEEENMCLHRCHVEELESCGNHQYFVVYQTQVQDNRCMDRRFLPSRSKLLQALASFPGAGNTWARHLIELATGFYSGSYYFDGSLYNKGFKGERDHWRSGRTICIKTHESGKKEIEAFDSGILMIRNPYKALMAEFNRKYGGHIGFASQAHWKGKEWPEFVKNYAPWWASHTLDWLRYGKRVHVVHFEDLKRDLFSQLKAMVLFLGPLVSEDRLLCVEGQKDGNFKRSGLRKLEYDPYTPEMRGDIDKLIRTVDVALKAKSMSGVPMEYMPR
ncbi:hypothetical protein NHX12_028510 [Muraenolepis orangiensis]|uniref:WSC domain-containing protein n=1 Tax=Muraenolepis orangiensis TaxID=630683 RepID=A0A9Q0EAC4_9TELE|nr:hypothetical protein NHX12_028510 [Muraenolepis orangiensis]